jgi:hypothetical protein
MGGGQGQKCGKKGWDAHGFLGSVVIRCKVLEYGVRTIYNVMFIIV